MLKYIFSVSTEIYRLSQQIIRPRYRMRNCKILKHIWLVFLLQLILNCLSVQVQIQDAKIQQPIIIALPSQRVSITQKNINQKIIVKEPMNLNMVFSSQIHDKSQNLNCSIVDWPLYKQTSFYYNINSKAKSRDSSNQSQNRHVQIVSAAFHKQNQDSIAYILKSDWQIQKIVKDNHNFKEQVVVYSCQQNQTMLQFQLFQQAYLYNVQYTLFLYVDFKMYNISFQQTAKTFSLTLISDLKNEIRQVVQTKDRLYLLCAETSIWTIQRNKISQIASVQQLMTENSSQIYNPLKFSAIAVDQNVVYILSKQNGILRIDFHNQMNILKIQHPNLAMSVKAYENTMLITYLVEGSTYIVEYFMELTNFNKKGVHLNKIYKNYIDIQEVIILDKYFLVATQSELIVAMHSINRNSPQFFHQKSEMISNEYLDQIYELRSIQNINSNSLSYLIILENSLSVIQFYQNQRLKYQESWIQCTSNSQSSNQFNITYLGLCANQKYQRKSAYCQLQLNADVKFIDQTTQSNNKDWKLILILLSIFIAWAILALVFKNYLNKQEKLMEQKVAKDGSRQKTREWKLPRQMISFQQNKDNKFNISQIQEREQ